MNEPTSEEQLDKETPTRSFPNAAWLTLGGNQFWTDHHWRGGWRLQRHALSGHWRLLNPRNVRMAWGSREQCLQRLDEERVELRGDHERIVFLLHGLLRSWRSMRSLGDYLTQNLPVTVAYFEYASSRGAIRQHAAAFAEVLAGLPSDVRIDLVCHSMGNIVVRRMLRDFETTGDPRLERIDHMVMLGPPNQGSSIARLLARTGVFGFLTGPGGLELGAGWEACSAELATPKCPFGIVAGRLPKGFNNPLVAGQGDFIVSVEETHLEGAADILEVRRLHSLMMNAPEVKSAVRNFLLHSRFDGAQ